MEVVCCGVFEFPGEIVIGAKPGDSWEFPKACLDQLQSSLVLNFAVLIC